MPLDFDRLTITTGGSIMHRMKFVASTIVCCAVFFSNLKGSEVGDVWLTQKSKSSSDRHFVSTECYINPGEERTLAFDSVGTIDFIIPEEGNVVKSDQVVAGLRADLAIAEEKVARIKAENMTGILFAEKSRDVAEIELEKANLANQKYGGSISAIDIARLKLDFEKSKLSVKKANDDKNVAGEEWNQAKAKLSSYRFTARIDGVVTKIFKKPGEAVRQGEPVMQIKDTRRVKIEGRLPFYNAVHVKPGALVIATFPNAPKTGVDRGNMKKYRGTVIFVDEKASRASKPPTMSFKAEFDNSDHTLIPGLSTTLTVYPEKKGPKVSRRK